MKLFKYIDHTLLSPTATFEDIRRLCMEGYEYRAASVCIPPCYVAFARRTFPGLNICTVVGFPLGYNTIVSKVNEAETLLHLGADEIDTVVNRGMIKNGDFDMVTQELTRIKKVCGDNILKVIAETCDLTEEEKIKLCDCVNKSGADFIKTSTGFGKSGAALEDVELFKAYISPNVRIKAAGGIRTEKEIRAFIDAGCSRIGTSAGVRILAEG